MLKRFLFTGPDGSLRLQIHAGEAEFVCAECDVIVIGSAPPRTCTSCGSDRIETLTTLRPAGWTENSADG